MASTGKSHGQGGQGTGRQGTSSAQGAAQRGHDMPGSGQQAQDTGLTQRVQDMTSTATQKAAQAASAVGEQMSNLAGTLRERMPQEGMMGAAATTVADSLTAGGRYLQQHDLEAIGKELTDLVRRYPIPCVLAGFGIGFLVGQTFSGR